MNNSRCRHWRWQGEGTALIDLKFNYPVWHDQPYVDEWGRSRPRDFFDQATQLRQLLAALEAPRTLPTAIIVGDRRAGKTSLLKLVAGHLAARPLQDDLPLFIRCGGINSCAELVLEIVHTISSRLGRDLPLIPPDVGPRAGPGPTPQLAAALGVLLHGTPRRIVLCLDEFDSILWSAQAEAAEILRQLRDLRAGPALPLALLLTMAGPPAAEVRIALGEPALIPITPFTREDTAFMVGTLFESSPLALSSAALDELHHLSGGWPYFTKLLLVYLHQQAAPNMAAALVQAVRDANAAATLCNIYEMRWDDDEKAVMLLCTETDEPLSVARLGGAGGAWQRAAERLVARYYLIRDGANGYRLRIAFLRPWLSHWTEYEEQVALRLAEPWGAVTLPHLD